MDKLRAMLRLLCRSLSLSRAGWVPLRRLFMALVIVYILVVRMNPGQFPPSLLSLTPIIQNISQNTPVRLISLLF